MNVITHPQFYEHGSFAHLKLGKDEPVLDSRTLELVKYVDAAVLPAIPPSHDLTVKVPSWPMYGNDVLGDCTVAAAGHMIEAWTCDVGGCKVPPDPVVEEFYWLTGHPSSTHGQPGGPTDTGRVELSILNYWRRHGLGGDKIGAYTKVNPTNTPLMKAGVYLAGGLYIGLALPETAQSQRVWDVVGDGKTGPSAPWSWGGHAVPIEAYDPAGVTIVTWGGLLRATWRFITTYCDEAYAILSPDFLAGGKTPDGINSAALAADLKLITG